MFNCFKKEKKAEPKKGLEITAADTPFDIRYDNRVIGSIVLCNDGRHRVSVFDSCVLLRSTDLLRLVAKLQDLDIGEA